MYKYSMKYRTDNNETIVYYVVAVVSICVLIYYGTSGDIPPIVGFLITGVGMYVVYPNETIALIMALIVSTILRKTKREGMEDEETDDADESQKPKTKTKTTTKDAMTEETALESISAIGANNANASDSVKTTVTPATKEEKKKQGFALTPADYGTPVSKPPSTQDMDKLSSMIDKTMKLIEMLPDGFLQNAANNNAA
jgi:hypothetical protein